MASKLLFTLALAIYVTVLPAQQTNGFAYQPYFSSAVVSNVDSSAKWYSAVFGMHVKNELRDSLGTYHIFILEAPGYMVELLQLKGSVPASGMLQGKPAGTQIQGLFKVGFKVPDANACLKHLEELKIKVEHIWQDAATHKRNFIITDPDGNLVQFFE